MGLQFITSESQFYQEAINIRIEAFFNKFDNALNLINDPLEKESIQIIYIEKGNILGTGRLNIASKKAIISQMAIRYTYKNKGIGSTILKALIDTSKQLNVTEIELSARETAIQFYRKFGFETFGRLYPSKKTGIIHQKMKLKL